MIKIPRVTKKLQAARAAFKVRILKFLSKYNPTPSNFYEFTLETPIGTMHLSIWESAIMCRFDNVAAAKVFTASNQSCNPYTGKWNWHYSDDAVTLNNEGCEAYWQMCMEKLMGLSLIVQSVGVESSQVCERHSKPIDPLSGTPPYLHRKGYCTQCNIGHSTNIGIDHGNNCNDSEDSSS